MHPSDIIFNAPADTDAVLIAAAVAGDRLSFEILVRRHSPALYRYAGSMLRDDGDAADAVQDTLVSAWRNLSSFRGDAAVSTWLFAICESRLIGGTERLTLVGLLD